MAVTCTIHKILGDLNEGGSKKVVLLSWGNNKPSLDIRKFENGTPFKGIGLNRDEAKELLELLNSLNIDELFDGESPTESPKKEDRKPVDLYSELSSASTIHDHRKKGYVTELDGRIKLQFKKQK